MRFEGTLKTWNDDRGFGFIEPAQGGQEIFVHIKAFGPRTGRPQPLQRVSFEVELGPQGRKRARNVELVRHMPTKRKARSDSPAQWGTATLFAIPAFALLFLVVALLWRPPALLALVYPAISVVTFAAYALDKSAAQRKAWRTPESTLHILALAGGWPGALLAQQFLRHKSAKAEFRAVFWGTVVLNVIGFVLICSPMTKAAWVGF
jgi:uncharacterized membrane protein YsdA (DUF1294 family)/cold shock CspA family protein